LFKCVLLKYDLYETVKSRASLRDLRFSGESEPGIFRIQRIIGSGFIRMRNMPLYIPCLPAGEGRIEKQDRVGKKSDPRVVF